MAERYVLGRPDLVRCEDLLVGDDSGCLYYYSVHWPDFASGSMTLLVKLDAHSQNVCGLSWSPDGKTFTSGGNDNSALLFEVNFVLSVLPSRMDASKKMEDNSDTRKISHSSSYLTPPQSPPNTSSATHRSYIAGRHDLIEQFGMHDTFQQSLGMITPPASPDRGRSTMREEQGAVNTTASTDSYGVTNRLQQNLENALANPGIDGLQMMHTRRFAHSAAVKAFDYAPLQPTLLATGGGSNDRQIHFHHTESGSTLAVINVDAQVTSLSWSSTRREIAATFGYAQPEHDIRIAVFAWPSCECVVSIAWERKGNGEIGRALWAIPYPGGPNDAAVSLEEEETDLGFQA